MGLYVEYYGRLRSTILTQDPLPSLNRAYQLTIQDERARMALEVPDDTGEVMEFVIRPSGRGHGRFERPNISHLSCTHGKKTGHEVA